LSAKGGLGWEPKRWGLSPAGKKELNLLYHTLTIKFFLCNKLKKIDEEK